jgi:hypothetical protein
MKRFYASSGALVVGILLVGSVHAGGHHSDPRSGHPSRSAHPPRQHSGHHWRALRPWRPQLPWQWLPVLPGGNDLNPGGDDLGPGDDDLDSGAYDSGPEGDDTGSGSPQPGRGIGGGTVPRPTVIPEGGSQGRPRFTNSTPPAPRSQTLRR